MLGEIIKELIRLHGDDLDFHSHHYYVFFEDGVFNVYIDDEEKELKADVIFSDEVKVYHSEKNLHKLLIKKTRDCQ